MTGQPGTFGPGHAEYVRKPWDKPKSPMYYVMRHQLARLLASRPDITYTPTDPADVPDWTPAELAYRCWLAYLDDLLADVDIVKVRAKRK